MRQFLQIVYLAVLVWLLAVAAFAQTGHFKGMISGNGRFVNGTFVLDPTATPIATPTAVATATSTPTATLAATPTASATATASAAPTVAAEIRPENTIANHRAPTAEEIVAFHANIHGAGMLDPSYMARVDGQFTGTTDEILQHYADKWFPHVTVTFNGQTYPFADVARAIAVTESRWHQTGNGGDSGVSWGIMQVKNTPDGGWPASDPLSRLSTPFNVDFKLAYQRAVYDGKLAYLNDPRRDLDALTNGQATYSTAIGDARIWCSVGNWYSGGWCDSKSNTYIGEVQVNLVNQLWRTPGF